MADATKTFNRSVYSHQSVVDGGQAVGEVTVTDLLSGFLSIFHGPVSSSSPSTGTLYIVRFTGDTTGDENWTPVQEFVSSGNQADQANIDGSESEGSTLLDVGSGEQSGFAEGQQIYIQDTGTVADGEWNIVQETATDQIAILNGLTNAKDSADDVFNEAAIFGIQLDLTAVKRIGVACINGSGITIHTKALLQTFDAIE